MSNNFFFLFLLIFQNSYTCPSLFNLFNKIFRSRQNSQENVQLPIEEIQKKQKEHQEIEEFCKSEQARLLKEYQEGKITEEQLKQCLVIMWTDCLFILPPQKLKELFPFIKGLSISRIEAKK